MRRTGKQISNSFVYDNQLLHLKQGISASGARYTDGIYVFWSKGEEATVYKRDRIVLNNCQLKIHSVEIFPGAAHNSVTH